MEELFPSSGAPGFVAQMALEVAGMPINAKTGELCYVRYRPTKDCVAQWSFPTPSGRPLLVSGKLFNDGEGSTITARQSFQRLAEKVRCASGGAVAFHRYLPDQQLFLQVFPLDVKLPGLALATSDAWAGETLAQALGRSPSRMAVVEATPLSYKAWHRCVIRYAVESQGRRLHYFGKLFRDDRGQPMVTRLRALKAKLMASGAPWDIPEPITYIPEARMLVLEALDGVEVSALLKQAPDNPSARQILRECITAAAEGLIPLQQVVVEGLSPVTPHALLRWLGRKTKGLRPVAPALAHSIEAQLHSLEGEATRFSPEPMVLTHGAFRHTQMLLCGDKLGLIDLDNLRLSGASADAGDFLGYLDRTALRRLRLRSVVQELEEAFVTALQRHTSLDFRWLDWYRAAARVKWTLRSFLSLSAKEDVIEALAPIGAAAGEGFQRHSEAKAC